VGVCLRVVVVCSSWATGGLCPLLVAGITHPYDQLLRCPDDRFREIRILAATPPPRQEAKDTATCLSERAVQRVAGNVWQERCSHFPLPLAARPSLRPEDAVNGRRQEFHYWPRAHADKVHRMLDDPIQLSSSDARLKNSISKLIKATHAHLKSAQSDALKPEPLFSMVSDVTTSRSILENQNWRLGQ
jgi:hypothetical protein